MRCFVVELVVPVGLVAALAACSSPSTPPPIASHTQERDATIVDSHVHLAFYPVADQLAIHGIRAAVDLAAPERMLGARYPIAVMQSGPMLTRPNGYPLDAWGSEGYGIGCDTHECVDEAVARLKREGASVIKIAMDADGLKPELAFTATVDAHQNGMKVVAHALSNEGAWRAASVGVDVLAHTPVEPLDDQTIAFWSNGSGRAVITTLAAFGGSPAAIENLRKLRAAGLVVLYGTDLGNLRVEGPSTDEITLMKRAGMTDEDVQNAMTTVPWQYWGFDDQPR